MKTENILYSKKVRSKFTNILNFLTCRSYYQLDDMSLKEKLYKFWYNSEKTGLTTKGEADYVLNISSDLYKKIRSEYNVDYAEYSQNPNK